MPRYTRKKWDNKYIVNSHNCYSYMLNKINKNYAKMCKKYRKKTRRSKCQFLKAQPGLYSGMRDVKHQRYYKCKNVDKRVLADNKYIFKTKNTCPKNYYKGMLFVDPKTTYHFYRQDKDGLWSHKDGLNRVTRRDAKLKLIKNPRKASRKYLPTKRESGLYYSRYCSTYCIPESKKKKHFSSFTTKSLSKKRTKKRRNKTRKR